MAHFFLSWQLWEQMTFALGCAMVLVVAAALCRNCWDWWNLRKHVRILKEQQAEQARLIRVHPSIRKRQMKSQVPFGIRAIQSGIEVDGVWISRPNSTVNSPSHTTPGSPLALEPRRSVGDKLTWANKKGDDSFNPVAAAARQLEMQTAGGRTIPPRAAKDPFRDSMVSASQRSEGSDKSDSGSHNSRKAGTASSYRDMPDEEAGYPTAARIQGTRRSSQIYVPEQNYQPSDYFSVTPGQPQAYVPTRRSDRRFSNHNSYVPSEAGSSHRSLHGRNSSNYGYTYPSGYSQPNTNLDSQLHAPPVELDIGDSFAGSSTPQLQNPPTRDLRNSHYGLVFSSLDPSLDARPSHARSQTPSPRESTTAGADPFATPLHYRAGQRPLSEQAPELAPPTRQITTRADAEAEASNMRRVNEGFSVARQGRRGDAEDPSAGARHATAHSALQESSREVAGGDKNEKKERKRLQKKEKRVELVVPGEKRESQFRENI